MKQSEIILLVGIAVVLMAFRSRSSSAYSVVLATFLPQWEGFSATPYWDFKQWSWGYGTRVPGSVDDPNIRPSGTITRTQAWNDTLAVLQADKAYLAPLLTVELNSNQWAAWLSFAYNLGTGNADNLVANINSGNLAALETQWKLYINAGGVPQQDLIARRAAEWQLYIS